MQITMTSQLSGEVNTMDIAVDEMKYMAWKAGMLKGDPLIQDAFPELTADEREFILTGITSQEWDDMFSEEE